MRNIVCRMVVVASLVGLGTGCTEPGEMTGVGAATGGIMGAGLGAIVGSQTGDPGAGLVIGAAAGAGAGAAVGNVLEAQDQAIRQQDEAIERQEQVIRANRGELDELRRLGQDSIRFRSKTPSQGVSPYSRSGSGSIALKNPHIGASTTRYQPPVRREIPSVGRAAPAVPQPMKANSLSTEEGERAISRSVQPSMPKSEAIVNEDQPGLVEEVASDVTARESQDQSIKNVEVKKMPPAIAEAQNAPAKVVAHTSADCLSAEEEYQQASTKSETPDKLFHIRRALRLCPDDARFHKSLGDIYTSLDRSGDAQFEYHEALKLAPNDQELKNKLSGKTTDAVEQY